MNGWIATVTEARQMLGRVAGVVADSAERGVVGLRRDHVSAMTDAELLDFLVVVENVARLAHAQSLLIAHEIEQRSDRALGDDGLAVRLGQRRASEVLERFTGVSGRTADQRIKLAKSVVSGRTLLGQTIPARFPAVGEAIRAGLIGTDQAAAIVNTLDPVSSRCQLQNLLTAETTLVEAASQTTETAQDTDPDQDLSAPDGPTLGCHLEPGMSADLIAIQARAWREALDSDGAEPREDRLHAQRGIRMGRERNGMTPINGLLTPIQAGIIRTVFDAYTSPRTGPAFLSETEQAQRDLAQDNRTREQQRADILTSIFEQHAAGESVPKIGGYAPTILIHVRADHLGAGSGTGTIDGQTEPVPVSAVKQMICTGKQQHVTFDITGHPINLGHSNRLFTKHQRRALIARDKGCVAPGCQVPASWCEAHHIQPWSERGPTDIANGVLLCWFHHRQTHKGKLHIASSGGMPRARLPKPVWRT